MEKEDEPEIEEKNEPAIEEKGSLVLENSSILNLFKIFFMMTMSWINFWRKQVCLILFKLKI